MPTLPFLSVFCMPLLTAELFSDSTSCPLWIHGASYSVPTRRIGGFPFCSSVPSFGWDLNFYSLWNHILFAQDFVVWLCFLFSLALLEVFAWKIPHFSEQSWYLEVALLIPDPLGKWQCSVASSLSGWNPGSFKCKFLPEQLDLSLPGAVIWTSASKCV